MERKRNGGGGPPEGRWRGRPQSPERFFARMSLRHIITLPDPKLRLVSKPIERVDAALTKLIDDMIQTMHDAPGIGLAAIQIAEPIRLLVVDVAKKD